MEEIDLALFNAVKENNTDSVLELLERGANPNAYETFLFRGYINYRRSVLHLSLWVTDDRGFSINVPENKKIGTALLDYGAEVNARDTDQFTPLRFAVLADRIEIIRLLLDRGADVNARDLQGQTPLTVAAFTRAAFVIEELLQRGAEVNAKTNFGSTALMHAVNYPEKSVERVCALLRHGADVNLTDDRGRTAMSHVECRLEIPEMAEIAEILRKHQSDE